MTAVEKPKTIEEVLLRLQQERPILAKTKTGQVGQQKTRYADLVQVNEVVLKLLNDMETIWTCRPTVVNGVFLLVYSLKHVPSNSEITGTWPLGATDNPQRMGSAVTYGRRYALLAVTGIVAEDEDDDGAAASGQRTVQRAPERRTPTRPATPATVQRATKPPLPGEVADPNAHERRHMHTLLTNLGMNDEQRREWIVKQIPRARDIKSTKELTGAELTSLIDVADEMLAAREMGANNVVDKGTATPPNTATETQ